MFNMIRRMRTRLPTCLSTGLGNIVDMRAFLLLVLIVVVGAISPSLGQRWAWGHFQSILIEQTRCYPISRHGGDDDRNNHKGYLCNNPHSLKSWPSPLALARLAGGWIPSPANHPSFLTF